MNTAQKHRIQQMMARARRIKCPRCGAMPKKRCIGEGGQRRKTMHDERIRQVSAPLGSYVGPRATAVKTRQMTPEEIREAFGD